MSEQGAFIGSIALSPIGMPGFVLGGAIGFAAGLFAERVDQVRARVSVAYAAVVKSEARAVANQEHARDALQAIETISVSGAADAEEAARLSAALGAFLERPPNKRCADCAARLKAKSDAWVSTNLGVVLCVKCAAAHRSLGTAVSRVKSPVYDTWDASVATELLEKGNERAAAMFYFTQPPSKPKPDCAMEERRAHAREKYVRMRWATAEARSERQAQLAKGRSRKAVGEWGEGNGAGRMPSLSSEAAAGTSR